MRSRVPLSKSYRFNLYFIFNIFGELSAKLLKQWIDANYRVVRAISKLQFLKDCKGNNIVPPHLTHLFYNKIQTFHHRSTRVIESVLHNYKLKVLDIEIFDLYRQIDFWKKKRTNLMSYLSNTFPGYIWNDVYKHHFILFNRFSKKMFFIHKKKFD